MYEEDGLTTWHDPDDDRDAPPAGTVPDAVRRCRLLAGTIGADGFSLLFLAVQDDAKRLVPVFDVDFPGICAFSKALSAKSAAAFTRLACEAAAPVWWRSGEMPPHLTATAQVWAREAASPLAGTRGIAFPVSVDRVRSGVIVFWGARMMLDETALCETHARCFALFGDVARQRRQDCAARPMSKREIECLRLTANGLTSDEIATALGLSVHTANQYLTNSTHKLDAVNRIHAVAKALRGGIID